MKSSFEIILASNPICSDTRDSLVVILSNVKKHSYSSTINSEKFFLVTAYISFL